MMLPILQVVFTETGTAGASRNWDLEAASTSTGATVHTQRMSE
jgi:hypothetical protein